MPPFPIIELDAPCAATMIRTSIVPFALSPVTFLHATLMMEGGSISIDSAHTEHLKLLVFPSLLSLKVGTDFDDDTFSIGRWDGLL